MPHLDPERLVLLALGEEALAKQEISHLDGCERCRTDMDSLRDVASLGRQTQRMRELPPPPEHVWRRIRAELADWERAGPPPTVNLHSDPHPSRPGTTDTGPGTTDTGPRATDAAGRHAADTGPRATDTGPRTTHTGPRATDTGRHAMEAGPHATDTGPYATDAGPRATDTGRHAMEAGPGAAEPAEDQEASSEAPQTAPPPWSTPPRDSAWPTPRSDAQWPTPPAGVLWPDGPDAVASGPPWDATARNQTPGPAGTDDALWDATARNDTPGPAGTHDTLWDATARNQTPGPAGTYDALWDATARDEADGRAGGRGTQAWYAPDEALGRAEAYGSVWGAPAHDGAAETRGVASDATSPPGRRRRPRWKVTAAITAAVVAALAGAGGTALLLHARDNGAECRAQDAQVRLEPLAGAPRGASGYACVRTFDGRRRIVLHAQGMPVQIDGDYEAWLVDDSGPTERVTALGLLGNGPSLSLAVPVTVDLTRYNIVDVSVEPHDGSALHSGQSMLRGRVR